MESKHERSVGRRRLWPGFRQDREGKVIYFDDIFWSDDETPTYTDRPASISPPLHDLPVILTEGCNMAGWRRSRFFHEQAAPPKTKPVI